MSLVAYGDAAEPDAAAIENNGFWPAIDPDDFRAVERIDKTITNPRATWALKVAIADVNRQLADWQAEQTDAGASAIGDVTPPPAQTKDVYTILYRRAVYATAHASVLERWRDYSATGDGAKAAEMKDLTADDYRRDARWAVAQILGRPHTTVELI